MAAAVGAPVAVARAQAAPTTSPVVRVGPQPAPPGTTTIQLSVNGTRYEVMAEPRWTLAEMLRDQLGLTGTKIPCDRGECGGCTVLMDGHAVLACTVLAPEAEGKEVLTIEGLAPAGQELSPLQAAFVNSGAVQCGFCTPGMLMSAKGLLDRNPNPSELEARAAIAGNLCRCTGYTKIVEGILAAAKT